jgi:hypothetical protein
MGVHERLDIAYWIDEFPLSRLRAEARDYVMRRRKELPDEYPNDNAVARHIELMSPEWEIVVGPANVAVNEQLKEEALAGGKCPEQRSLTDIVVWAKGEPSNRAVTKVGGLPYRPSSASWPEDVTGTPQRFIAQLCFLDSRDLAPQLPGDVLLIFGDDDALLGEPERLLFEWWPIASHPLVSEMPVVDAPLSPFYAVLHRTEDWDNAVFEGTKIGGIPKFIQGEPTASGIFIGAIGSISVPTDARHPFVNVAEPRAWSDDNDLMIGDMGSLYLFVAPDGKVQADSQCY